MTNCVCLTETEGKDEFYPTPAELADKMLTGIDWRYIETLLEPSAGKGNLVEAALNAHKVLRNWTAQSLDVDCIEIDENLRHILKGKGFRVVHDDFLTYQSQKQYDLILMNPPFACGDKHLLKALEMQKDGGSIICLLNEETIKNPYTLSRKLLLRKLEEYDAKIETVGTAFDKAERKTGVKVAVVKVYIPRQERPSTIYTKLEAAAQAEDPIPEAKDLTEYDLLKRLVRQYEVETKASIQLIEEYKAMVPYMLVSYQKENPYNAPILKMTIGDSYDDLSTNSYLQKVRSKYWRALFANEKFVGKLTENLRKKYMDMVDKLKNYEFSLFNIEMIQAQMNAELEVGLCDTIMQLFDKLSAEHSWYPESKMNVHYFNGWKTNQAHRVNPKKVIVPIYGAFPTYAWADKAFDVYTTHAFLADIEKALNYLDGHMTAEVALFESLEAAAKAKRTRNISCKYFDVDLYKKGTVHIKFNCPKLIEKLNIYAAQNRSWLPPSYGKATYDEMAADDQAVVDSFQGKEAYKEVLANANYYLTAPIGLLRIES